MTRTKVHLVGMGLLGSLTAWMLDKYRIRFTWEDSNNDVNAWKACTGACYPSGDELDRRCYDQWQEWLRGETGPFPKFAMQTCAYWVDGQTKSLPHGLVQPVVVNQGPMRLVGRSFHIDAQRFVKHTREAFGLYRKNPLPLSTQLVSHGFHHRTTRYLWGWTRLVRLKIPANMWYYGRPCLYLRRNRFQFAYAFPKPYSRWWYAGSSLVNQLQPKSLNSTPRYDHWKEWFAELTDGQVRVTAEGEYMEGWRPVGESVSGHDAGAYDLEAKHGRVYFPPVPTGGFRHFPAVWEKVAALLELG
jgi:hypothetical protein